MKLDPCETAQFRAAEQWWFAEASRSPDLVAVFTYSAAERGSDLCLQNGSLMPAARAKSRTAGLCVARTCLSETPRCFREVGAHVEAAVETVDMSRDARLAAHSAVSAALARCSDLELRDLVDAAEPMGSGIGGTSALLDIGGTPVFVKRVPLSDLERQPENVRSTANLFELPAFSHFGVGVIGGPGFGAWRELAVHTMTTNWVLAQDHEGFPLMYHWRVLPHPGQSLPEELADVEKAVAYWGGGSEVRRRIEALRDSSASIALFLEYIPQNLHDWLGAQVKAGDEAAERACAMVVRQLQAGTSFMNARWSPALRCPLPEHSDRR